MKVQAVVAGLFVSCSLAFAGDDIVLGKTLFDSGAKMMSESESKVFLAVGANVETYAPGTGAVRYWTNEPSGKFIASRQGGTANARSQGTGEWKITDNGQYCVVIEWRGRTGSATGDESWCRVVYLHDGEKYLAPRDLSANLDKKYSVVRVK